MLLTCQTNKGVDIAKVRLLAQVLNINCYETCNEINLPKTMLNNYTLIVVAQGNSGHALLYIPRI